MITDWKQEIAIAWLVKQALMEADKKKIWPYHLPEVAATEDQLRAAEQFLGFTIDPRYREFLMHANGWQAFWHTADLFGTSDLIAGPKRENAEFVLSMLDDAVLSRSSLNRKDLLPISATEFDRDIFVILAPSSPAAGTVVWFAGEEVERFPNFDEYFLAMVNYNRIALQRLKEQSAD